MKELQARWEIDYGIFSIGDDIVAGELWTFQPFIVTTRTLIAQTKGGIEIWSRAL